jgi:hypothetical protein
MGILYAKEEKIYCNDYMELYIPKSYFDNGVAQNHGDNIEAFGVLYTRAFENGTPGPIRLWNMPVMNHFMLYNSRIDMIEVNGKSVDVLVLEYPKDSFIIHQSIPDGRLLANFFLNMVLSGKIPKEINYRKTINIWWKNLEISGFNYKVPSKMFEFILAATYRNPHNMKERYGQLYGRQTNPSGIDYKTENVRNVVKDLSTYSGMIFEDMGGMITNGINNSLNNVEEPVSPLEKIIHY